jgi:DNA (cytosine-5)-methyltransferase 1
VLENVPFMLQLQKGRGLRVLLDAFEERGYRWAYRVVNTLSFLPQRRERVLLVATTTEVDPAGVLSADETNSNIPATDLSRQAHGFYWTEGVRGLGWATDAIPTLKNGSTVGIASPPAILLPSGEVVTPDIRDAERLQGFYEDWTAPALAVGKGALRWSLVGNAVSVPVAEWLGQRLAAPGHYDRTRDRPLKDNAPWPKAARFDGSQRWGVSINSYPAWLPRAPLASFLRHPGKPLSERATQGFLTRAARGSLRFPDGFLARLQEHLFRVRTEYAIAAE